MKAWQLQEAKARFSEVVDLALRDGPQTVTRRGENAVVILSHGTYLALTQAHTSLDDALSGAPEPLEPGRNRELVPATTLE